MDCSHYTITSHIKGKHLKQDKNKETNKVSFTVHLNDLSAIFVSFFNKLPFIVTSHDAFSA